MSFETKRVKSKLSNRITRTFAALFSAIFFALSVGVFLLAYQILLQKQTDHLNNAAILIGDNLIEEIEEGEALSGTSVLDTLNSDYNLSIFIFNNEGTLINRVLNFPIPTAQYQAFNLTPEAFYSNNTLMLCISRSIAQDNTTYGRLTLIYSMTNETSVLKLLGFLLFGANLAGVAIAFFVSRFTSRRMLAPIGQMIDAANRIDSSTLDKRLDVPEPDDELKNLALTINGMLDRVAAAYRQQSRFVADVSHELRTPLAVMQGNLDLLTRWGAEDKAVRDDSIQALLKQTVYMSALVENLLFLARSDNAQTRLNRTVFSVGELFDELIEEQTLIDPQHHYEQSISGENSRISADRTMIRQMLRALLDNSVSYTPEGGTISLAFSRGEGTVSLSVHDNGIGMSQEDCEHIFERFYRVDAARTRTTGGMGLGLSLVLAIAQSHNGRATVESEPGRGTTVTVTLPSDAFETAE